MVPDEVTRALGRCRASGTEWGVMACLLRYQRREGGRVVLSRPVADMAAELGMREDAVRRALGSLTRRGVIERVATGHNGRAATYTLAVAGSGGEPSHDTAGETTDEPRESPAWRRAHEAGEAGELFGRVLGGIGGR